MSKDNSIQTGYRFIADKLYTMNEQGPSTVIKQKKSGMIMFVTDEGRESEISKTDINKCKPIPKITTKYYYEPGDFGGPVAIIDSRGRFDNEDGHEG